MNAADLGAGPWTDVPTVAVASARRAYWSTFCSLAVGLAALAAGCVPDRNPRAGPDLPEGVTAKLIAEGEGIFLKEGFCYICHDRDGSGGMGADLLDDEWWHSDGSYGGIVGTILSGVNGEQSMRGPQSTMPPKGGTQISDAQVLAVAAYVWSLRLPTPELSLERD